MVDFGDELIIRSFRIPWLLWIQLLVFLLLLILILCSFAFCAPDPTDDASSASTSSTVFAIRHSRITQSDENRSIKGEIEASRTISVVRGDRDNIEEEENQFSRFIRLAKSLFLKCLGLDSTSESDLRRKKND